jgi:hypothetical protein
VGDREALEVAARAGGTLTDAQSASWLFSNGGYIASNSIIHGWTLRCLQRVLRNDPVRPSIER